MGIRYELHIRQTFIICHCCTPSRDMLDQKMINKDPCGSKSLRQVVRPEWEQFGNLIQLYPLNNSIEVVISADDRIKLSESIQTGHEWVVFVTYGVVRYIFSLRRNEGFILHLQGTHQKQDRNDGTFFIVALLGKIKGKNINRSYLIPCSNRTSSGLEVKKFVSRILKQKQQLGFGTGPAISDSHVNLLHSSYMDMM